jgi:hypothetical protein
MLLFEFRRVAHLDRAFTTVREGSMDVFPRAALIPHLEQRSHPLPVSMGRALSEAATLPDTSWNVRQPREGLQPLLAPPY